MSELRRDPILRRWVIMAPERAGDVVPRRGEPPAASGDAAEPCPFCPGHEALNPDEITVVRDGSGWLVRVTPDKKPLLRIEGELSRRAAGMFDLMNAIGVCFGGDSRRAHVTAAPGRTFPCRRWSASWVFTATAPATCGATRASASCSC